MIKLKLLFITLIFFPIISKCSIKQLGNYSQDQDFIVRLTWKNCKDTKAYLPKKSMKKDKLGKMGCNLNSAEFFLNESDYKNKKPIASIKKSKEFCNYLNIYKINNSKDIFIITCSEYPDHNLSEIKNFEKLQQLVYDEFLNFQIKGLNNVFDYAPLYQQKMLPVKEIK